MFDKLLPKDINIYATTASLPTENSYQWDLDSTRHTYINDLYSISWMEHAEFHDLQKETLQDQFEYTKKATNLSHV